MAATSRDNTIRLPAGWPRRVRSSVVHAISLAHFSLTASRGWAANSWNARVRLREENDRLRQETHLLREELRIKDSRMACVPAQRRPHYPPTERLAILELRAARSWSLAQTARTFLVTPLTIASWTVRLDEEGPEGLVRLSEPVNRFPDFVGYLVKRLKVLCPAMGRVRIARVLARAGLHLGPTTVRRMMRSPRLPKPHPALESAPHLITARKPNDLWHVDLTTVPTALGFWTSWIPFALPQAWPFCWWVDVAIDHCSRRVMGFAIYRGQPSAKAVLRFLERLIAEVGQPPRDLISDQGRQFVAKEFRRWCRRRGIRQRFGAIGQYGSLAVIERCIRTIKTECTRRLVAVPYRLADFERELGLYFSWYGSHRPHTRLRSATPNEVYFHRRPAVRAPRFEPRSRWPRRSPCAAPQTLIRGQPGVRLDLAIRYHGGRKHLPIVTLKRVA
jgi:putative transposase